MKVLALTVVILGLSGVSAEAASPGPSCKDTYAHHTASRTRDSGTTAALPNGGFQTTYADGWTHTSEPDSSYGGGGRQMTDKDNTGRVRLVTKCDPKNIVRLETESDYRNGQITSTTTTWNAKGVQTGKDVNRMAAADPMLAPNPQVQQPSPTQPTPSGQTVGGGPPPGDQGTGGPPPGYDQSSNGPPPPYDQGSYSPPPGYDQGGPPPTGPPIGVGGVGFGFGFGIGHKF
jgi:hypothetical protein